MTTIPVTGPDPDTRDEDIQEEAAEQAAPLQDEEPVEAEAGAATEDAEDADAAEAADAPEASAEANAEAAVEEAERIVEEAAENLKEEVADAASELLAKAQSEAKEAKDKFLRLQAEWENYRKRTAQERNDERKRATSKLVEKLLPVLDDIDRALEHAEGSSTESLTEGVAAVRNKFVQVLETEGAHVIDPLGEPFDINIHQAVGTSDNTELYDETITAVYQKGLEMGGRCIRPAMVVVSKGGPERPKDEDPEEAPEGAAEDIPEEAPAEEPVEECTEASVDDAPAEEVPAQEEDGSGGAGESQE